MNDQQHKTETEMNLHRVQEAQTCFFIVLNFKSTNISLSNFYEETNLKPCLTTETALKRDLALVGWGISFNNRPNE